MKIRYTQIFNNSTTLQKVFTIQEIEDGKVLSWLNTNIEENQNKNYNLYRDRFSTITDKLGEDIFENDVFEDEGYCAFNDGRFYKVWETKDEDGFNHWEDLYSDSYDFVVGNIYKKENE